LIAKFTALGKLSQDEVEEFTKEDSSSSSQRKRPTKTNPCAKAAKFVAFADLFKSPKASEVVATHMGQTFCKEISKSVEKSLELPAKEFVACPCNGRT
jgi:hypothetical protein